MSSASWIAARPLRRTARGLAGLALAVLLLAGFVGASLAQEPWREAKKGAGPAPPEETVLSTSDGVELAATYYPGGETKATIPLMLVHGWKGDRQQLRSLALYLQGKKYAVIVPDLRGHGKSTHAYLAETDQSFEILADQMRSEEIARMTLDLEAAKRFLIAKNNEGQLNINKLCVVGVEFGAIPALQWAADDWAYPPLATGKQGQDVRAVALVSPEWTFKSVSAAEAMEDPNVSQQLSVLLIAGRGDKRALKNVRRFHKQFAAGRPADGDDSDDRESLFLETPDTSLQGIPLLNERGLNLPETIADFIEGQLGKRPIPWAERKSAL